MPGFRVGPEAVRAGTGDSALVIATASHPSASFSATIRVRLEDRPGSFGRLATAIGEAGGSLGAIDLVRVEGAAKVRDVTVEATDAAHIERIVEAVRAVDGVEVDHVSDRTFLLHLGGKLRVESKTPIRTREKSWSPGRSFVIGPDPGSERTSRLGKESRVVALALCG